MKSAAFFTWPEKHMMCEQSRVTCSRMTIQAVLKHSQCDGEQEHKCKYVKTSPPPLLPC